MSQVVGWKRFRLILWEYLSDGLTVVATLTLASAGIGASYSWPRPLVFCLLLVGGLLALIGIFYDRRKHRPTLTALSDENASLKAEAESLRLRVETGNLDLLKVVEVLLRNLAVGAGLYKPDARLSVYRHDQGCFTLLGRVSENAIYSRPGRRSYPDTQGFIAQVANGTNDKPKVTLPSTKAEWIETQVRTYGFSETEAKALRMYTRAMCGARLQRDQHSHVYGVLCVESDKAQATVKASTTKTLIDAPEFQILVDILALAVTSIGGEEVRRGLMSTSEG